MHGTCALVTPAEITDPAAKTTAKDDRPRLDAQGHFPGCYVSSCAATCCAEARAIREAVKNGVLK